jgi:hypothetical protein
MLIFPISIVIVTIIALCFYKNKFWENRYIILSIIGGVALVATLTANFIARGHLTTKVETVWVKPIYRFYMPDSVYLKNVSYVDTIIDTTHVTIAQVSLFKHYNWYNDHSPSEFYKSKDTTKPQNRITAIIYSTDKKGRELYIGVIKSPYKQSHYDFREITNVYVASSGNDTVSYVTKKRLVYNVPTNRWLSGFNFPRVKIARIIYLPPREYDMIPKSLIKKLPF